MGEGEGAFVGFDRGARVGEIEVLLYARRGPSVGVGINVGTAVGLAVGMTVGMRVGAKARRVGTTVGIIAAATVIMGVGVGSAVTSGVYKLTFLVYVTADAFVFLICVGELTDERRPLI